MNSVVVAVYVALSAVFIAASAQLRWTQLSDNDGPGPRVGGAIAYDYISNSIVLFGGATNESTRPNDVWTYSPDNDEWTQVINETSTGPNGRSFFFSGIVTYNNITMLVVAYGFGAGGAEYDDVWVFRLDLYEWTLVTIENQGQAPPTRYGGHSGALYGPTDTLWMGSGFTVTTSLPTRYIDTYKLVFSGMASARWEEVYGQPSRGNQFNPLAPHGRCLQGSAVVEADKLVMFGGCMRGGTGGGPCPTDDSWYFDDGRGDWVELPRCATPRRWVAMAAISNSPGKAMLYGGTEIDNGQVISAPLYPEEEVLVVDVNDETWTRYMPTGDSFPVRRYSHAMSAGRDGAVFVYGGKLYSDDVTILGDLWMVSGALNETVTVDCDRVWFSYAHLHGLFQVIGFGILFPLGALVARYYQCKKSKVWFIVHISIQLTALVFAIIGFVLIFVAGASPEPTHPHAIIGIILMTLMVIQPINGIFRPHIKEGKEKSLYRKIWEWFHRLWGASVIVLGLLQVTMGVFLIVPPLGVWVVWILMLGAWFITFVVHEIVKVLRWFMCSGEDDDEGTEMKKLY